MAFVDTRINSLETARECMQLGARQRTIAWMTGLPAGFIRRRLFDESHRAPRGRPPYAEDFVFHAPLRVQAEISGFAFKYRQLTDGGLSPAHALIAAYRHHLTVVPAPSFCFDEAFFLVSNLDGIWAASGRTVELSQCSRCACVHVVALGSVARGSCPFCKSCALSSTDDSRYAAPKATLRCADPVCCGAVPAHLEQSIRSLRFQRDLQRLGAHPRIAAAISSTPLDGEGGPGSRRLKSALCIGRPLSLRRWGEAVPTLRRMEYAIVAVAYRRLLNAGFDGEDAVRAAFIHASSVVPDATALSFDRCFEAIALLDLRWGGKRCELQLVPCTKCGAHHLVSRQDRSEASCPFCALIRRPRLYV
jgi:flagellar transcriptional activator FlhC